MTSSAVQEKRSVPITNSPITVVVTLDSIDTNRDFSYLRLNVRRALMLNKKREVYCFHVGQFGLVAPFCQQCHVKFDMNTNQSK